MSNESTSATTTPCSGRKSPRDWGFPEAVQAAVRYHHNSDAYRGTETDAVRCVEVANLVCTLKGISSVGRKLVRFSPSVLSHLSLGKDDILILSQDLDEAVQPTWGFSASDSDGSNFPRHQRADSGSRRRRRRRTASVTPVESFRDLAPTLILVGGRRWPTCLRRRLLRTGQPPRNEPPAACHGGASGLGSGVPFRGRHGYRPARGSGGAN